MNGLKCLDLLGLAAAPKQDAALPQGEEVWLIGIGLWPICRRVVTKARAVRKDSKTFRPRYSQNE
jgi:hypothetical protein